MIGHYFIVVCKCLLDVANFFAVICFIYTAILRYWNHKKIEIILPCGSFKIRRKNLNIGNLTNITSYYFYNGGKVPDEIRKKLVKYTNSEIFNMTINKNSTESNAQ